MTERVTHDPEKLWELIGDIRFAMFTTRSAEGVLHSRPMTTQNKAADEGGSLWFFMSRSGEAVRDLQHDPLVNVAYADPDKDRYVSVAGTAALVEDRARKQALWSTMNDAWFPKGVDDPDLALVEVRIIEAAYWDVKTNKLVQLVKMATASITGNPPQMGERGELRMR